MNKRKQKKAAKKPETGVLYIVVPETLREDIMYLATISRRSITAIVREACEQYVEQRTEGATK